MILSDIKQYLKQRGSASLSDISIHFDTDPDAVRSMLEQWIRKGKVNKLSAKATCGSSCNKCEQEGSEIYHWVDAANNSFKGISITPERHDEQT
jgi:putative ferrous iron transport protein C